MLTVVLQASQLKSLVICEEQLTVINVVMEVQMLDSIGDLESTVLPRLGELHTVMSDDCTEGPLYIH